MAASRKASLTCAAVTGLPSSTVRSTTETLAVGTRMAMPSSLPLSSGSTRPTAVAAPGGGRDHAHRARPRPPEILVREVVDGLVVRIRVHGRGEAALDAEVVEKHLGHGGQTVGGAGGVGDELVLGRVVLALVDAQHHGDVGILGGRGDHDLLRAGLQMLGRGGLVAEDAGGLHHDVHAELAPRQGGGILDRAHADFRGRPPRWSSPLAVTSAPRLPCTESCLSRCAERLGVGEVIDRHHLDILGRQRCPEEDPPDTPEPVDPHSHRHVVGSSPSTCQG